MKNVWMLLALVLGLSGCGRGFEAIDQSGSDASPQPKQEVVFPVATAIVSVNAYGDLAAWRYKKPGLLSLAIPMAIAAVPAVQANGVVSVTYTNPGATSFTLNTSGFMAGSFPQAVGDDLNLGTIAISALDDNSLKVCTGVGAPGNKCNKLLIRVFTLGSNVANTITGIAGFINTDSTSPYGIDVRAGSVTTPIGWNASASAVNPTDAAQVFSYTIPGNLNRVRLSNTGAISFPLKADLSNAGSGNYEMRLVIQYALTYIP